MQINALIEDKQIIRIVQPTLHEQLMERVKNGRFSNQIIYHQGHLFLSLQKITDPQERENTFLLLRDYQIGKEIDLNDLPNAIHAAITGSDHYESNFITSLTISTFAGSFIGIFTLAFSIIFLMVLGVSLFSDAGIRIATIFFAGGALLGCTGFMFRFWQRIKNQEI
jgi:hypothetical protein